MNGVFDGVPRIPDEKCVLTPYESANFKFCELVMRINQIQARICDPNVGPNARERYALSVRLKECENEHAQLVAGMIEPPAAQS